MRTQLQTKEASDIVAVVSEMVVQIIGNPSDILKAGSRVVQGFIQGRGLIQIESEVKMLRDNGELAELRDISG